MEIMARHVDREGYVHVEARVQPVESEFAQEAQADLFMVKAKLIDIVDFDKREENGFEFWHVKGF